ncbi:MAG: hypothetical protein AB7S50_01940 [Bacteroidales bacterium]
MTGKRKSNHIEINALLNTFTVKEITEMFTTIEEKIMSLHSCSSNDFQMLNANFKEIYRLAKVTDQSINKGLSRLKKNKIDASVDLLVNSNNKIAEFFKDSDIKVKELEKTLKNSSDKLTSLFIPLKNHSQDLMSLKLLLTNLNFYQTTEKKGNTDLEKPIRDAEHLVIKCKLLTEKKYKELNLLRRRIKATILLINQLLNIQSEISKTIKAEVKKSAQILTQIERIIKNKPLYAKRNDDLSTSVDYIIINLQYHDIIRQKMEHIQHTHNDFLHELDVFNKDNNQKKYINEKAKQFIRIRDIAGLHAAKLLQTNKEYRQAIEIIVKSFLRITKAISRKSAYIQKLSVYNKNANNIKSELDKIKKRFENKYNRVAEELNLLKLGFDSDIKTTAQLHELEDQLHHLLSKHSSAFQIRFGENKNAQYSLSQISLYINYLGSKSELNSKHFLPFAKMHSELRETKSELPAIKTYSSNISKISSVITKIHHNFKEILGNVKQHDISNNKLLENIKNSISSIKYYSIFDTTINEIIQILSSINIRLKTSYSGYLTASSENLDHLKNYYTMDIEHRIHDRVLKKKSTSKKKNKGDEMDIEFF